MTFRTRCVRIRGSKGIPRQTPTFRHASFAPFPLDTVMSAVHGIPAPKVQHPFPVVYVRPTFKLPVDNFYVVIRLALATACPLFTDGPKLRQTPPSYPGRFIPYDAVQVRTWDFQRHLQLTDTEREPTAAHHPALQTRLVIYGSARPRTSAPSNARVEICR